MPTMISKRAAFPFISGTDYGVLILQSRSTKEIMELFDEMRKLVLRLDQDHYGVGTNNSSDTHSIEVHWGGARKLVTFRQHRIKLSDDGSGWMVGVTMEVEHEYQPEVGNDGYMSTTVRQSTTYAMVRETVDDSVKNGCSRLSGWLIDPKTTVSELFLPPATPE